MEQEIRIQVLRCFYTASPHQPSTACTHAIDPDVHNRSDRLIDCAHQISKLPAALRNKNHLHELLELKKAGALDDAEFKAAKQELFAPVSILPSHPARANQLIVPSANKLIMNGQVPQSVSLVLPALDPPLIKHKKRKASST